jgi:hypothetical protein
MAMALDIGGSFIEYNTSDSPEEADRKAIASDWAAVYDDMRNAFNEINRSLDAE